MKANNKGTKNLTCEGSCRQTTMSRRKDRPPLTDKELEIFDKEMEKFFKNYKSPIGSESGQPSLIIFVCFVQALRHFLASPARVQVMYIQEYML